MYNPMNKTLYTYDLIVDPLESVRVNLSEQQARQIVDEIIEWRNNSVFEIRQDMSGKVILFDHWFCRWRGRLGSAKYRRPT